MQQSTFRLSLLKSAFLLAPLAAVALAGCTVPAPDDAADTDGMPVVSSDDPDAGNAPQRQVTQQGAAAAREALASELGVRPQAVEIIETRERTWPDGCLGLGEENEACTEAIVPGYEVIMRHEGTEYRYRASADGSIVRDESSE